MARAHSRREGGRWRWSPPAAVRAAQTRSFSSSRSPGGGLPSARPHPSLCPLKEEDKAGAWSLEARGRAAVWEAEELGWVRRPEGRCGVDFFL